MTYTAEQLEAMARDNPGALDALVERVVFGAKPTNGDDVFCDEVGVHMAPDYAGSWDGMGAVLEAMEAKGANWDLCRVMNGGAMCYMALSNMVYFVRKAKDAPTAVAIAAVLACQGAKQGAAQGSE